MQMAFTGAVEAIFIWVQSLGEIWPLCFYEDVDGKGLVWGSKGLYC